MTEHTAHTAHLVPFSLRQSMTIENRILSWLGQGELSLNRLVNRIWPEGDAEWHEFHGSLEALARRGQIEPLIRDGLVTFRRVEG